MASLNTAAQDHYIAFKDWVSTQSNQELCTEEIVSYTNLKWLKRDEDQELARQQAEASEKAPKTTEKQMDRWSPILLTLFGDVTHDIGTSYATLKGLGFPSDMEHGPGILKMVAYIEDQAGQCESINYLKGKFSFGED